MAESRIDVTVKAPKSSLAIPTQVHAWPSRPPTLRPPWRRQSEGGNETGLV